MNSIPVVFQFLYTTHVSWFIGDLHLQSHVKQPKEVLLMSSLIFSLLPFFHSEGLLVTLRLPNNLISRSAD